MAGAANAATVLLVHGSAHGPWCWERVIELATVRGLRTVAVALPSCGPDPHGLGGPDDDIEAVRAAIDAAGAPVVLVGHSLGGMPVSEAAAGAEPVRHLVYLAAFMLDVGETVADATRDLPPGDWVLSPDGRTVAAAEPSALFYGDCAPEVAAGAIARLRPQNPATALRPLRAAAWRSVPSTYVVCERDRAIPPALQERWARRASRVVRLDAAHSPFLSRPGAVVDVLDDAVDGRFAPH
jgi:pimeloyl-ACP methyl ester carboxylesterase